MYKTIITMTSILFFNLGNAQNKIYNSAGDKKTFSKEKISIIFSDKGVNIPYTNKEEAATAIYSLLPTITDAAFKIATKYLENREKSFTAEYSKQLSFLDANTRIVPDMKFIRNVRLKDSKNKILENGLTISIKAEEVKDIGFVYVIDTIDLKYSSAKITNNGKTLDYTIEIKPTFLINGEKKVQEVNPIVISSVEFGPNLFKDNENRSSIIPLPKNAMLIEVSIKVIESNPAKVRAEKILETWNDHKDSLQTIIKEVLPKEDDEEEEEEKEEDKEGENKSDDPKTEKGTKEDNKPISNKKKN